MSHELVTVATFADAATANLAKNQLDDKGIHAFLADAEAVSMAWHLSGAIGGVKLQVAEADADAARDVLAEPPADEEELEQAWKVPSEEGAPAAGEQPEAADAPLTAREQAAVRVLRGAIIALALPVGELLVCWLLWDVLRSTEPMRPRYRRYMLIAAWIAIPLGVFAGLFCMYLAIELMEAVTSSRRY